MKKIGKKYDLSSRKVGAICGLLKNTGLSQYEIAKRIGVSRSSVKNIKKKIDSGITLSPKRKEACGRRRITTPWADRKIRDICLENRKMPINALVSKVNDAGISVKKRTLQRRLAENNLLGRRPARKPKLTPTMMTKRLHWARKYKYFTIEDWKRVNIE